MEIPHEALARDGIREPDYRKRWWTLAVLTLSLVMVVMGNSSLNVAMPTFVEDLGTSDTELQWIIDSYALVFGGLLLTMGALGDRFGRKGAMQVGLLLFGGATLATALFADAGSDIIAMRTIMGIGAALVMPATLSILTTVFPREERGKAIGIWAAFAGLGGMIGIISSGWLLEHFAWRSIFWINVPIVTIALGAGLWLVPTSRDPDQSPLDIVGSILSILALGGLLFAIIEGPNEGWTSATILGTGAASLVLLGVFIWWERRTTHPMLPMAFFRERGFNAGVTVILLTFFAMFAIFFVITQYIQFVQGYSPFAAGLRFLPLGFGMILGAPNSDRFVRRLGAAPVVTLGLLLVASGLASLALLEVDDPYWRVGSTFLLMGFGMGLSMAPATTVIMSSIPARKAGVGSSMNDTAREIGGAFGIAILGTILKDVYVDKVRAAFPAGMPAEARQEAEAGVGKALMEASKMGPEGAAFAAAARDAFATAMAPAFWVACAIVVGAALLVAVYFPRRVDRPEPRGTPGGDTGPAAPPHVMPTAVPAPGPTRTVGPLFTLQGGVLARSDPDGRIVWRYSLPRDVVPVGAPVAANGHVAVLARRDGEAAILVLSADAGTRAWGYRWRGAAIVDAEIAADEERLLVTLKGRTQETATIAHALIDGRVLWRRNGRAT